MNEEPPKKDYLSGQIESLDYTPIKIAYEG
jgi:hypothetical protein